MAAAVAVVVVLRACCDHLSADMRHSGIAGHTVGVAVVLASICIGVVVALENLCQKVLRWHAP